MTVPSARPASRSPQRPRGGWPVGERSMLPSVLGIPPLGAVGFAFGFTLLGVFVDVQRIGTLGGVFRALYFTGCVLAVTWVRRRDLFAPVVQPPLLLAVAVPVVVLLGDDAGGSGSTLFTVAAPLINSFPAMAVTSGAALAVGLARLALQRVPRRDDGTPWRGRSARTDGDTEGDTRTDGDVSAARRPDSAGARGEGRRRASPRRS